MERALAWDAATHNGFEPKAACRAQIAEQRRGMGELIAHVRANEASSAATAPQTAAEPLTCPGDG